MKLIKTIMQAINEKKEIIENKSYRYHSIVSQTLPLYHDRFGTTNKNTVELSYGDDRITKLNLESQDGVPIQFHKDFGQKSSKNFCKSTGSLDFQKNGIEHGMIINISGNGFLENEDSVYEVVLVTDEFVYMRNMEYNSVYPNSYREIEKMRSLNAFKTI